MIANVTNSDCSAHVDPFYNVVGLAKMMTLNKEFNAHAMELLGKTYGKKVPKTGLMHMGRVLTHRNQEIAKKHMLPGIKHAEATLGMKCMLCDKKCPSISEYGFVGHSKCIKKKEKVINGRTSIIEWDMLPYLTSLKKRELYTSGLTHYAIKEGIPGVFPHALSLDGYIARHGLEIAQAREKAATKKRIKAEKDEEIRVKVEKQANIVKADIEAITGIPYDMWAEKAKVIDYPSTKRAKTGEETMVYTEQEREIPRFFLKFALRCETGQECLDTLEEFKKHPFLLEHMFFILRSNARETIDYREAMAKIKYFVGRKEIDEKIKALKASCATWWNNEEYNSLEAMKGALKWW